MSGADPLRSLPLAAMLSEAASDEDFANARSFLVFDAGERTYALDANAIETVVGRRFITPLPSGPAELLGVTSVMGRMRLVVDLRTVEEGRGREMGRLIVLHGDAQLAIVAEKISGVYPIPNDSVIPVENRGHVVAEVSTGGRTASVIDPERILRI